MCMPVSAFLHTDNTIQDFLSAIILLMLLQPLHRAVCHTGCPRRAYLFIKLHFRIMRTVGPSLIQISCGQIHKHRRYFFRNHGKIL